MTISCLDLKHAGWNLMLGYAVTNIKIIAEVKQGGEIYHVKWVKLIAGLGAAALINWSLSGSRFGIIHNPSLETMVKLGIIQSMAGCALDLWVAEDKFPTRTLLGAGAALAAYAPRYALFGFGAYGILLNTFRHPRQQ
jgi:hypothetical protein